MKNWPRSPNKCVNFGEIITPIVEAGRHLFKIDWDGKDVPYDGLPLGMALQAGVPDPDHQLSADSLVYNRDEQGRDELATFVSVMIQVGIEQGRRIDREKEGARTRHEIRTAIEGAVQKLAEDFEVKDPRLFAVLVEDEVNRRLKDSEDLLTQIHFERD